MFIDVEAYSAAGYRFEGKRYYPIEKNKKGIAAVGSAAYCEHHSTEPLSLVYGRESDDLHLWVPRLPGPRLLFDAIHNGELIYAHNVAFEFWFWFNIFYARMGWPPIPRKQFRDTMALAQAWGLPGALGDVGKALNLNVQKDAEGTRLLNKFSVPRKPTKANPRLRLWPCEDLPDAQRLYGYNITDVDACKAIADACPPISPFELDVWLLDQDINERGIAIDLEGLVTLQSFVDDIAEEFNAELQAITGGLVVDSNKLPDMAKFMAARGLPVDSLDKDHIKVLLKQDPPIPPDLKRMLEIRQLLGQSSVKKLAAMSRMVTRDGRLHELFSYCGAPRTGRFAGRGPQPQNLKSSGPRDDWGIEHIEEVLACPSYARLKELYDDPLQAVAGSIRGLFVAGQGMDLICSDYSSVEAMCLAFLSGEQWRMNVFNTHGRIYEATCADITGIPLEEILAHKERTGSHHPKRKPLGKIPELALGYGGWINACKNFGADKYFDSDRAIRDMIVAWREKSPMVDEFWGDQVRKVRNDTGWYDFHYERYGLEGACVNAIQHPGQEFSYRSITYFVTNGILHCRLPSGRHLYYHNPRLVPGLHNLSKMPVWKITFMGMYNRSDGPKQWTRLTTYGGKLAENVTQAVARDLLVFGMLNADRAGYKIVLHVHDEPVAEVLEGWGSVEEFERLISIAPPWAKEWPVRAAGGWRGKRYRKE